MPTKPSLGAKMCPAKCFKINIGMCRYKGTEPIKSLVFSDFSKMVHPLDVFKGLLVHLPLLLKAGSNVCFYFVQRIVDLCESLFDP